MQTTLPHAPSRARAPVFARRLALIAARSRTLVASCKGAAAFLLLGGVLALAPLLPAEPAVLASWNIRHLGHGELKEYSALGEVVRLGKFDFLAVQEAMTAEGVHSLHSAIEAATGSEWEMMYSHRLGRGTHKEKYAFLWNTAVVEYVDGAVVYLDITDRFAREPYSARFRVRESGLTFVAATTHILYGRGVADRTPEIEALAEYWNWLEEIYPNEAGRILLMGDFNLPPKHAAWAAVRGSARPLIVAGETTLSTVDGRFANLYDNIWLPVAPDLPIEAYGIFEFPLALDMTHEQARRHVSDHAPVWLRLDSATEHSEDALRDAAPRR